MPLESNRDEIVSVKAVVLCFCQNGFQQNENILFFWEHPFFSLSCSLPQITHFPPLIFYLFAILCLLVTKGSNNRYDHESAIEDRKNTQSSLRDGAFEWWRRVWRKRRNRNYEDIHYKIQISQRDRRFSRLVCHETKIILLQPHGPRSPDDYVTSLNQSDKGRLVSGLFQRKVQKWSNVEVFSLIKTYVSLTCQIKNRIIFRIERYLDKQSTATILCEAVAS